MNRMKNNKAAGEDGLTAEFLKYLPRIWTGELVKILNEVFDKGELLKGWEVARIYPIHKGGDENVVTNYRGISSLDVGYKLLTNIMAERLRRWLEKTGGLREYQAGLRNKRGTRDHCFVLNSLINNKLKKKGGK